MKTPRILLAIALLVLAPWAQALEVAPYTPAALAEAQAAGKPVALHFHADWCPTCRAQQKVLDGLKQDKSLDLTVLTVDYDKEKELKQTLGVRSQSTLIVYRGKEEKARSAGETTSGQVKTTLQSAL